MWSLAFFALLLGTCVERGLSVPAFGMMGAMPYGYGMGFPSTPPMDLSTEPELLNCFASFLTPGGTNVANELAVTIEPRIDLSTSMHNGGMGLGYGMGYGTMDPYSMQGDGQGSSGQRLSARIELISNVAGGTGFVVFTSRARVDDGCEAENFGEVLTPRSNNAGMGQLGMGMGHHGMGLGMGGMGLGMGYGMGYGMGGGMGYGMGYGMGHGMGYGMGHGMGFGLGMGHAMGSMLDFDSDDDRGVVTEINITPGALTTAVVEDIGFTDLKDLAGRGVLVCSSLSYDWDWQPKCEAPFFSCCNLKYDNKGVGLSDNDDD